MEKYKLNILDPLEFEDICAEILSKKLGYNFKTYKAGADDGIDAKYEVDDKLIIVQCKRYSDFKSLKSILPNEVSKLKKYANLSDYYLMISFELNPTQEDEIFSIFSGYMHNKGNIIDGKEIAEFLDDNTNSDILRRHVKLWLYNSSILTLIESQNIFIDSEVLLDEIKMNEELYVENSYFNDCLKLLQKNNCLLIYGDPGVGKSTLSKMLILYFVNLYEKENIKVRYSSISDYEALKKSISIDKSEREIILIDDFLGQIYSEIQQNNTKSLLTLVQFIKKCPNKILILNSRIGILKNAYTNISFFERELAKVGINFLELKEYSQIVKGRILYNYLKRKIPNEKYFINIKDRKKYWEIINHRNFNPRIIENITNEHFYKNIEPTEYFSKIMMILDNPSQIWKDEYSTHIQPEDRIMLNSIFSLSNYGVKYELLEKVFWHKIGKRKFDVTSSNLFEDSMKRMVDSYIKIIGDGKTKRVQMINNSINDFLNAFFDSNPMGKKELLEEANISDQLVKIEKWNLETKCVDNEIYKYITKNRFDNEYIEYSYGLLRIIKSRDMNMLAANDYEEISDILFSEKYNIKSNLNYIKSFLINDFFVNNYNFVEKYFLNKIKCDSKLLLLLFKNLDMEIANVLLKSFNKIDNQFLIKNIDMINEYINESYMQEAMNDALSFAYEKLNDAIQDSEEYINGEIYPAETDEVFNYLVEITYEYICEQNTFFDDKISLVIDQYDVECVIDGMDIAKEIKSYYSGEPDYDDYDDHDDYDSNYVDELFNY